MLVIGSGPTGLIAARDAARAGAKVILAEDDFELGGRLLSERLEVGGQDAASFAGSIRSELDAATNVRVMTRTTVFGVYDHGIYGLSLIHI